MNTFCQCAYTLGTNERISNLSCQTHGRKDAARVKDMARVIATSPQFSFAAAYEDFVTNRQPSGIEMRD